MNSITLNLTDDQTKRILKILGEEEPVVKLPDDVDVFGGHEEKKEETMNHDNCKHSPHYKVTAACARGEKVDNTYYK